MGSLEELLSSINSGAVDVTASAAAKRQPKKPKAQTELSKRLRGQTNAVNTTGQAAKAQEKRGAAAAPRVTPPPVAAAAAAAAAATAAAAGAGGISLGPPTSIGPPAPAVVAAVAPAGPPPVAADAPLTMRLKRVLDLLRSNRDPFTFADVRTKLHVDLNTDTELLEQLASHSHVTYDPIDRTIRYRPKLTGINNATDLLNYLRRNTTVEGASSAVPMTGVRLGDLSDAYLGAEADIKRLQAEGAVFVFGHTNAGQETIYAVQEMPIGPISESVNEMFHNTPLPADIVDLQWRCRDLGLKSLLAARPVRKRDGADGKDGKKKKRRKVERRFNVDRATNAHMRELFEGAQPTNIDMK